MHESAQHPLPIGLSLVQSSPSAMVEAVVHAEAGGLPAVWSTVGRANPDAVTTLAVAAARTQRIKIGTSIVPAYTRHPVVLASQALVFADLAPGRFRLGVGPSHRPVIEGAFGVPMQRPLTYMREYVTVLRQLLWEGRSDFDGEFLRVHIDLPAGTTPPRTPILVSALRPNAFHQAGEISDGAISWVCPIGYLVDRALPELQRGAKSSGRDRPPLVAHVLVAMTADRRVALDSGRDFLARYARLPFYAGMFEVAGYPVGNDGTVPDALVEDLIIWGDGTKVIDGLRQALARGLDELLVTVLPMDGAQGSERELIEALASSW